MTYKIQDIQGVGPEYAEKFKRFDIHTTDDLLKMMRDERAYRTFIERSGFTTTQLDKWKAMSLLMRINGIGPQYAELLFWSEVDRVEKLRDRPAEELLRLLTNVNNEKNLTNALPHLTDVQKWIDQARSMEPVHNR